MTADTKAAFNARVFTQVINMDRSVERLRVVDAYLRAAGVEYVRLPAADGRALDLENDPEVRGMFDLQGWARRHHRNPTPADIGCYLSHYRAIAAFLKQDKPLGLIFEDDAALSADFIDRITPAINDAEAWDILKLHARHPGQFVVRRKYPNGVALCSFVTKHAGGTAYVINRDAAQKMLKHLVPAVRMIDWAHDEGHIMNLRVRAIAPMPVSLQPVPSTRESMKGKRGWIERHTDRPILPRWQLPFRRAADDIHRVFFNLFNDGGLRAMMRGGD